MQIKIQELTSEAFTAYGKVIEMPPLERFQTFRVRQGQSALLGKGVWHGALMALDQPL